MRRNNVCAYETKAKKLFVFDKTDALEYNGSFDYFKYKISPVLTLSAIAGLVAGFIVTLFNFLLETVNKYGGELMKLVGNNLEYLPLYLTGVLTVGLLGSLLIKKLPVARGSGIPRTEAMLVGRKKLSWWRIALSTIIGSTLSFGTGLSVGSEGPSVQVGAGLGLGIEKLRGKNKFWSTFISSGGAAAGFAAAFGAPLTGLIFLQEEVHRKISPLNVAACAIAVAFGYAVRSSVAPLLGMKTLFFESAVPLSMPESYLWIPLVTGVVAAAASFFFNTVILAIDRRVKKKKRNIFITVTAIFAVTAIINVFFPQNFGSGLSAIRQMISGGSVDSTSTLILLALKFVMVFCCFYSGATGGMMVPMLALGALTGGALGFAFLQIGMPQETFALIVLITMCSFFGSGILAPFTVILMFIETTGTTAAIFPLVLSVFVSYTISRILKQRPLYDTLAERDYDKDAVPAYIEYD